MREHVPLGTFIERLDLPSITQVKIKASASPHLGEEAPSTPFVWNPSAEDPGEKPILDKNIVMNVEDKAPPWVFDLIGFLQHHILPEDVQEAECVAH
jgi:hypothetical protein